MDPVALGLHGQPWWVSLGIGRAPDLGKGSAGTAMGIGSIQGVSALEEEACLVESLS